MPRRLPTISFPSLLGSTPLLAPRATPPFQLLLPWGFLYHQLPLRICGLATALAGYRILHLSDLHLRRLWGQPYDRLIERIRANPPGLILFTGDFTDDKCDHRLSLPTVQRLFRALAEAAPVYAILGNHDPDVLAPYVAELGVTFITHRRVVVDVGSAQLELIGFPGTARQDLDREFCRELPPRRLGTPRIVLCHYPDLFPAALNLDPDLYLAGHTHGGQICLPTGRAIISHDRMPKRFAKGVHRVGATTYCVTNGFGFTGLPFRLFCPPETVEFTLEADTSSATR